MWAIETVRLSDGTEIGVERRDNVAIIRTDKAEIPVPIHYLGTLVSLLQRPDTKDAIDEAYNYGRQLLNRLNSQSVTAQVVLGAMGESRDRVVRLLDETSAETSSCARAMEFLRSVGLGVVPLGPIGEDEFHPEIGFGALAAVSPALTNEFFDLEAEYQSAVDSSSEADAKAALDAKNQEIKTILSRVEMLRRVLKTQRDAAEKALASLLASTVATHAPGEVPQESPTKAAARRRASQSAIEAKVTAQQIAVSEARKLRKEAAQKRAEEREKGQG